MTGDLLRFSSRHRPFPSRASSSMGAQHTLLQRHRERTSYISHSCPIVRTGADASEPTPAGLMVHGKPSCSPPLKQPQHLP
ncbi:hypothetical protein R6Z07F_006942 [Ovis aries]